MSMATDGLRLKKLTAGMAALVLGAGALLAVYPAAADPKAALRPGTTPISSHPWKPSGGEKVVYGDDDRRDEYAVDTPEQRAWAGSVCALVDTSRLEPLPGGRWALRVSDYSENDYPPCSDEPFANQPTAAYCTGFLVGDDVIATAGHCYTDSDITAAAFVFGFSMADADTPILEFDADQVYWGASILSRGYDPEGIGEDHCIIRLNRPVTAPGAYPLPIRRSGVIDVDTTIGVIGHPSGLPKKIAFGNATKVADNSADTYFVANLDTFGGNSGSPVFNVATGVVEGILVRGADDFVFDTDCFRSNRLEDGDASEESSKTTIFEGSILPSVTDDGVIRLVSSSVKPGNPLNITVRDGNAGAAPTLTVTTDGGDSESLLLTAVVGFAGFYTGVLPTIEGSAIGGNNSLEISSGQTFTIRYEDLQNSDGQAETVEFHGTADTQAPQPGALSVITITQGLASVSFDTNEDAIGGIRAFDSEDNPAVDVRTGEFAVSHPLILDTLLPGHTYRLRAYAIDKAGNEGSADAAADTSITMLPANNSCETAFPITYATPFTGSSLWSDISDDLQCTLGDGSVVWHSFTAPIPAAYRISLCGSVFDTTLTVFRGSCDDLALVDCNDDSCNTQSEVCITLNQGDTCYMRVAGFGGGAGRYTITSRILGCDTPIAAADECADAVAIEPITSVIGNNEAATTSAPFLNGNDGADVWHRFDPTAAGDYFITLRGTTFPATLGIYHGACETPETVQVAPQDETAPSLCIHLLGGESYRIRVAGIGNATGNYCLGLYPGCPDTSEGEGEVTEGETPVEGEVVEGEVVEGEIVEGETPVEGEITEGEPPVEGEIIEGESPAEGEVIEGELPAEGEPELEDAAAQLLDQFRQADSNGDRRLSPDEVRAILPDISDAEFARLDHDHDGQLSRHELQHYLSPGEHSHHDHEEGIFAAILAVLLTVLGGFLSGGCRGAGFGA